MGVMVMVPVMVVLLYVMSVMTYPVKVTAHEQQRGVAHKDEGCRHHHHNHHHHLHQQV